LSQRSIGVDFFFSYYEGQLTRIFVYEGIQWLRVRYHSLKFSCILGIVLV